MTKRNEILTLVPPSTQGITTREIMDKLGLKKVTVNHWLRILIERGDIYKSGSTKSARYHLYEKVDLISSNSLSFHFDDFKINMDCLKYYFTLPHTKGVPLSRGKVATKYRYLKDLVDIGLVKKTRAEFVNKDGKRSHVWRRKYKRMTICDELIMFN